MHSVFNEFTGFYNVTYEFDYNAPLVLIANADSKHEYFAGYFSRIGYLDDAIYYHELELGGLFEEAKAEFAELADFI